MSGRRCPYQNYSHSHVLRKIFFTNLSYFHFLFPLGEQGGKVARNIKVTNTYFIPVACCSQSLLSRECHEDGDIDNNGTEED